MELDSAGLWGRFGSQFHSQRDATPTCLSRMCLLSHVVCGIQHYNIVPPRFSHGPLCCLHAFSSVTRSPRAWFTRFFFMR
jgi:hypothetical protein